MTSWSIEFVNAIAEKEIKKLSPDLQADFLHLAELLVEFGPQNIGMPHTRAIDGKIWELRLRVRIISRDLSIILQMGVEL